MRRLLRWGIWTNAATLMVTLGSALALLSIKIVLGDPSLPICLLVFMVSHELCPRPMLTTTSYALQRRVYTYFAFFFLQLVTGPLYRSQVAMHWS